MNITEINNPIERFVAFIAEREAIRVRRFIMKKPWPWTNDSILQEYRFTNVHREDDAVSQHYQKTVRSCYIDDPLIVPATVIYRWFNRPSTCDAIFGRSHEHPRSKFDLYINSRNLDILQDCINQLPPPHVTGAFIITGKPGFSKAEGVLQYIHEWCKRPWEDLWKVWKKYPPLLSEMYAQINSEGLGSFMRGQLVADLKYLPFMLGVDDWYDWATPGPGSMKGLNIVMDRPMMAPYSKGQWLSELQDLAMTVTPLLKGFGIERLHNQDLQNCLCEWSKYTKVATGVGRPRQVFKNKEPVDV
jgi:hypothetical protein